MTRNARLDTRALDPLEGFPFADSETLEGAPPCCPRCGTGVWKDTPSGLQCRVCPGQWLIAERLRESLSRARETEAWGHRVQRPAARRAS